MFAAHCVLDSDGDTHAKGLKEYYSKQMKRSLGDRGRTLNIDSETRFWVCAARDGS